MSNNWKWQRHCSV